LLATASTDFKCRIFSAFIKGVDQKIPNTPFGNKLPFGEMFAEIDCLGWVQSVQWSPSGNKVAFCGQDSTVSVADVSSGQPNVQTVKYKDLPFRDCLWTNETSIICVGHDCTPVLFQDKGGWQLARKIDQGSEPASGGAQKSTSAFKVFQNKVDLGSEAVETKITTKHQNCISCVIAYKKSGPNVTQYSTSGLDGVIIIWDAK